MLKESYSDILLRKLRETKIKNLIPADSKLCDLGCGSGRLLHSLASNIKEGVGVDRSVRSHKLANLTFIRADLENKIKLSSSRFDVVVSLAVLEHLNKPENLIKEAYRMLNKDGRIIMTTPSKLSKPILEFLVFKLHLVNKEQIKEHKHYFTKDELNSLLKKVGFRDIKLSYFEFGMNILFTARK